MVIRHGQRYIVVAKFQGELPATEKRLVVPALVVAIRSEARKPLGQEKDVRVALVEVLVAAAGAESLALDDIKGPRQVDFNGLA